MADSDSEVQRLYVQAKSLSDSKDLDLSISACNKLIEAAKADSQLLDKAFTIYRYVYRRSNPKAELYSWFEKGVLKDFPDLVHVHPKSTKLKPTSGGYDSVSDASNRKFESSEIWNRIKYFAQTSKASEQEKIKQFCEDRRIHSLLHFSHAANLKSIMNHGILGRESLDAKGLLFHSTDEKRLDLLPNGISLSISRPNLLMLSYKTRTLQTGNWIVFDISPAILLTHEFAAFPSNAASSDLRTALSADPRKFCGAYGLKQMFTDGRVAARAIVDVGSHVSRRALELPDNVTTDPQAELMMLSKIEPNSIRRIMASTSATANYADHLAEIEAKFPSITIQRDFELLDAPFDLSGLKERTLSWQSIDQVMRNDVG
jgi:hypothetical protein